MFLVAPAILTLVGLAPAAETRTPGQSYFGAHRYVEYVAGDLPIVLTSPHGGRLSPDALPDRKQGVLAMDVNTQELARAIAAELLARTGRHAHLIASHLHRRKLDPNREIKEAAQGNAAAERAWREFHASIEGPLAAAVAAHGFAFLIGIENASRRSPSTHSPCSCASATNSSSPRNHDLAPLRGRCGASALPVGRIRIRRRQLSRIT